MRETEAPPRARESPRLQAPPATVWTPVGGRARLRGYTAPETVSKTPPPDTGFGVRLVAIFGAVAFFLVVVHRVLFYALDEVTRWVGAAIFWPMAWPGLLVHPTLQRTLPDFVLLTYLAIMIAFCLASRLFTDPKFTPRQRETALLILGSYFAASALVDAISFVFPERLVASAFLLLRAIVGAVFFSLLLFNSLVLPAPIDIRRRFARDRRATLTLAVSALLSIVLSLALLSVLYRTVNLGRGLGTFAVLLLMPFVAITIWGGIGRILYEAELKLRPLRSLEEYHPSVTIIIPAFNEENEIAFSVASADVAAGLYPGTTEIVVANDGSVDGTGERARAAIGSLAHSTGAVLDLPHGGKSNALNGGLSVARGEIVVRIDADARISSTRGFGPLVSHFEDPEVGGVQGLILPLQSNTWTSKLRFMEIAWNHLYLRRAMMATRTTQVVDGAFCAFRRRDLLEVGGWVPWNGEDTEITLRLQRQGFRMRFEEGAAAFEDVPANYQELRKQRIRWNRGGLFAHRRHMGGLFGEAFEFGGLAMLLWLTFFVRGGLRSLVWVYAIIITVIAGLPTVFNVALIAGLLLIPRGIVIGYYMVHFGRWRFLPYIALWPVAGSIKQFFSLEAYGTMLPGAVAEFAE
ncbi:MAG TPA: glycosyltransferase family 2 protein [Thermoplasmata archaeon]